MTKDADLENEYFYWLLDLIDDPDYDQSRYSRVLEKLYSVPFYDLVPNDCNRADDGLELRNEFADFIGEHLYYVMDVLPEDCSILEMMAALAKRWEDNITWDPDLGDRTGVWFWLMMDNLGLTFYTDKKYDEKEVTDILENFLERRYCTDGRGSLFRVNNPNIDMRQVEIWYQMNYFFDENPQLLG